MAAEREQRALVPNGGVLRLTPGLRWRQGMDFFVLGAYAAYQLGPGSLNLMGAQAGAARVARELKLGLGLGLRKQLSKEEQLEVVDEVARKKAGPRGKGRRRRKGGRRR